MNEQDNKVVSGSEARVEDNQTAVLEQRHFMIAEAAYFTAPSAADFRAVIQLLTGWRRRLKSKPCFERLQSQLIIREHE